MFKTIGVEPSAKPPSTRAWGRVFWLVVAILLSGTCLLLVMPALRAEVFGTYDGLRLSAVEFHQAYMPQQLQPFVAKGAEVFLTPWLYLLMLVVLIAEKYIPARQEQKAFSVGMIQDFVAWFTLNGFLRTVVTGAYVALLYKLYSFYLSGLTIDFAAGWPLAAQAVAAFVLMDFLNWFHHYVRHKVKPFWVFHAIHHSQHQMNMFTDLRVHVVEYLISLPLYYTPLFLFHLDVELAFWLVLLRNSYARIYHGNIRSNYGWLRYLLVTPQSHRIHHSADPRHADKNFAVIFSVWDRLFGTQWTRYDEYPDTGITDDGFPHEQDVHGIKILTNYLRQMAYPFHVLWRAAHGKGWELQAMQPQQPHQTNPPTPDEQNRRMQRRDSAA